MERGAGRGMMVSALAVGTLRDRRKDEDASTTMTL